MRPARSSAVATMTGLTLSFRFDLPTGPIIVCSFALVLIAAFVLRRFWPSGADDPATNAPVHAD